MLMRLAGALPRGAWACALVALANGLAWSLIVPPFQVPDENAHYAYVAQVAEKAALPRPLSPEGPLSPREDQTLSALQTYGIIEQRDNPVPSTDVQQKALERVESERLSATGDGDVLSATSNPPLYYLLQAVPYKLMPSGSVLNKLAVMRFFSALMGAVTVLLVFMFLRELLPDTRWAWLAGSLVVAFQPLFGFVSGGVNNDSLLYLAAAGTLWGLARAFRRGLTPASGGLVGGFLGMGLIAKLTLIAFVPGVGLALVLLLRRDGAGQRRSAAAGALTATAFSAAPMLVYAAANGLIWGRALIPGGVGAIGAQTGRHFSLAEEAGHVWQLFLPHLWMRPQFSHLPLWSTWFVGFIGRFGWLDYGFPSWVYAAARAVAVAVVALALVELARRRGGLRRRADELAVYALLVVGLCVEIGAESYRFLIATGGVFQQARYLLPLLGFYGALVALAVRAGGRRWGPVIAAVLVALAIGHDLYAQGVTIARYYA